MKSFLILLVFKVTLICGQGKQCAKDGEYCLTASDCCSRSCLSFSYKCVPSHQGPSTSFVSIPSQQQQQPTGIVNRFKSETSCAKDGDYCLSHSDCCSKNCLSFSYKCAPLAQSAWRPPTNLPTQPTFINRFEGSSSERPANQQQTSVQPQQQPQCAKDGEYCLTHSECCSRSCLSFAYKCVPVAPHATTSVVYVPPPPTTTTTSDSGIINRFEGDDSTTSTATTTTTQKQCAQNGEYCLTSSDCCSRSCLSFSYKCVPTHSNIFQNFPVFQATPVAAFENRFGNNENCLANGNTCNYAEQCCSKACYKGKCATEIQIGISETELLKPSAVNGPVVFVNNLDDLLDKFAENERKTKKN